MISAQTKDYLEKTYPTGTEVVLESVMDDPNPVPVGTKGIVTHIDDTGTIHVNWEDGRSLGCLLGVDSVVKTPLNGEVLDLFRGNDQK